MTAKDFVNDLATYMVLFAATIYVANSIHWNVGILLCIVYGSIAIVGVGDEIAERQRSKQQKTDEKAIRITDDEVL
jgi:hypothetical protein